METTIHVYADWILPDGGGLPAPQLVGTLTSTLTRNKELFNFEYAAEWLASSHAVILNLYKPTHDRFIVRFLLHRGCPEERLGYCH